jgi:ribosomal protein S18 acetylase RimI-like enzyme
MLSLVDRLSNSGHAEFMNGTQVKPAGPAASGMVAPMVIRPAGPADLPALRQFFTGLSKQSRYMRFFGPIGTPNSALLNLLAGGPSHVDAVVATAGGVIIGHVMAADQAGPGGERRTDIGVVVADAWQGHGVGVALMRAAIARAQARGVRLVVMDVLHANHRALAMITGHWSTTHAGQAREYATLRLQVPAPTPQALAV